MKIRFVGDVHGKIPQYLDVIKDAEHSIQVGDMGIGFVDVPVLPKNHRWIRGNHDNPALAKEHPNYLDDGTIYNGMMCIGGAWSIDRQYRTEGLDWWADEELSYQRLFELIKFACDYRPKVMVTHDCPSSMIPVLFPNAIPIQTRTQNALDVILNEVKPELWVFGHWHRSIDFCNKAMYDTRFVCLNELEYKDIEV